MTSAYNVKPAPFEKKLKVPTSKSYANRILILAAISPEVTRISGVPESTDVKTMITLLRELGLEIEQSDDQVIVKNSFPECEKEKGMTLHTGDGGTTNRFILPLLARGKNEYILEPEGHMRSRPMEPLIMGLKALGACVSRSDDYWIKIKGPINPNCKQIEISTKESTQFATGLTLAVVDKDIEIVTKKIEASKNYFLMTKHLVEEFKAQRREWVVPVDFSSISYPLALAAVQGSVQILNCDKVDDLQADSMFIRILEEMGVDVILENGQLRLDKPSSLLPFEADGFNYPDLVPTLAFIASYTSGTSIIRNIEILRHKESDRVEEILKLLKTFKIEYEFDLKTHNLIIYGNPQNLVESLEYFAPADHRIIMVAYLFMRVNSGGILHNASHVKKSFPRFFDVMK